MGCSEGKLCQTSSVSPTWGKSGIIPMASQNPRGTHSGLQLLGPLSGTQTGTERALPGGSWLLPSPCHLTASGSVKTRGRAREPP